MRFGHARPQCRVPHLPRWTLDRLVGNNLPRRAGGFNRNLYTNQHRTLLDLVELDETHTL